MSPLRSSEPSDAHEVGLEVAGMSLRLTFGPGLGEVAAEIANLWRHLRADGAEPPRITLDYALSGTEMPEGTLPLRAQPAATYTVSGHITREVIRALIGTRLLLHAGAVTHPELGTVLLVGASGAGKSTAASRLGRADEYLTDELTILDAKSFAITPYPKPVSRYDSGLGAKRDRALPELGLRPPPDDRDLGPEVQGATEPSLIVLLDRIQDDETAERSSATRVPLAEALLRIVPQTSSLWEVPSGLAALAALLETTGGAVEVRYRDASELEELLHGIAPAAPEEVVEIERVEDRGMIEGGQVTVAPFRQALAIESGVFVLGASEAIHLAGLTALVWDLLRTTGPLTPAELEEQIVQELGEHPESAALLRNALAELAGRGWLRQG
jgi:hypothetical protein